MILLAWFTSKMFSFILEILTLYVWQNSFWGQSFNEKKTERVSSIFSFADVFARRDTQAKIAKVCMFHAVLILVKMAVIVARSTHTTTNVLVLKVCTNILSFLTHLSWSYLELYPSPACMLGRYAAPQSRNSRGARGPRAPAVILRSRYF